MTHDAPLVLFRADASAEMGAGHVMRCLALAGALQRRGAVAAFASRAMPAALARRCAAQGVALHALQAGDDARASATVASRAGADAVVVDHYGLDASWERAQRPTVRCVLAIDDLADRSHDADLLLDQNLGRRAEDYAPWLPPGRDRLLGPAYALLRPEFAAARSASLVARAGDSARRHLVVSLGGGDPQGATLQVLRALVGAELPVGLRISVVLGPLAPTLQAVRALAASLPCPAEVLTAVEDMATLLASAELAVGAAGGSAWERCCLGVPTLLLVLADNQRAGAEALAAAGAARLLGRLTELPRVLPASLRELCADADALRAMSRAAAAVTDGLGAERVADALLARLRLP